MKKLLLFCLVFSLAFSAEPNPFADSGSGDNMGDDDSIFADETPKSATNKLMYLDAVQKKFWSPSRKPSDNTLNIKYVAGESHKIRTRANMTTTFIFDDDKIASVILGDSTGFELKELGTSKYDLSNIITIKPKLVGIDTNLTIIGESGNIYTFYVFSTDHKNRRNPAFLVFISETRKVGKIKVENLEEKAKKEQEKVFKRLVNNANNSNTDSIEEETENEIIIGDATNKIKINKNEIKRTYVQYPKKNWGVVSKASAKLQAKDIFHDKKWTYFKFDRDLATSKFPAIFRVVDGYDNPMNSRIVGNYLIIETIADKWTMRIGNEWVCVRNKEYIANALQEEKERKERLNNKKITKSHSKIKKIKPANNSSSAFKWVEPKNDENEVAESKENDNIEAIQPQHEQLIKEKEALINEFMNTKEQLQEMREELEKLKLKANTTNTDNGANDSDNSKNIAPNVIETKDLPKEEAIDLLQDSQVESQEQNYQGEFDEAEKEMTKEQQAEVESHYKGLELPQGMPIENVIVEDNDI